MKVPSNMFFMSFLKPMAPQGFFGRFELRGISLFVDGSGNVVDSMDVKMFEDVVWTYGMC